MSVFLISKVVGHTNVQSTLDVIPHISKVLENSILLGVERIAHTGNKGTALYGYRLYNLYWYDDGKAKTPHALVCTVVQDVNKAEGYVFQNIENVTIDRGLPGTTTGMSSPVNDDTYTVAQLYRTVKEIDRFDGGLKYTDDARAKYLFSYTERDDGVKYSDRDTESVSNRSLLANAFDSVAQTDEERSNLQKYRKEIASREDNDVIYPVILHIAKTRDGRYLLYDVSVIKNEGTSIDMDATALAALSARAPGPEENGTRSAVKILEPSEERVTHPEDKVKYKGDMTEIRYSDRIEDLTEEDVYRLIKNSNHGEYALRSFVPVRRDTPPLLVWLSPKYGLVPLKNLPIIMNVEHIQQCMDDEVAANDGKRGHVLTADDVIKIVKGLDNPRYVFFQKDNKRYCEVVEYATGEKGERALAIVTYAGNKTRTL